jgi:hypothetical protein
MRGVTEWNLDVNRANKRVAATLQEPLESDSRRRFGIFASLLNDLEPSFRQKNVAICSILRMGGKSI